ncbi:MAG TPA: hypothetical protein VH396_09865 [Chitinophagaceae bacterium]|jgi:uncharacterized membrane protein
MKKEFFYYALSLLAIVASCTNKKESITPPVTDVCGSTPASFSNDVHVIFETSCAKSGCHNSASAAGGVILETYDPIVSKIDRIQQRALVDKTMPPTGPLSTKDINTIQCWINSGVPNN